MQVAGTSPKQDRVDACGTWIGVWQVIITGQIVKPDATTSIQTTLMLDTEEGGLFAMDDVTLAPMTAGVDAVPTEHVVNTISSDVPKAVPAK
jgi:hypothetical protein